MALGTYPSISAICKNNSYLVLIDPQLKENNGYLRSIPLLYALSPFTNVSIRSWEAGNNCKFPLNILNSAQVTYDLITTPLVDNELSFIAINEERDRNLSYVHKYIERMNAPRIFISPVYDYVPEGWPSGDRTIEDETVEITQNFDKLYYHYLKNNPLADFTLRETKNIAFIELAYRTYQLTGKKIHSIFSLFDYENPDFILSPIWDIAAEIINSRAENLVSDWKIFIFNSLRPWIERNSDVDKLSSILLNIIDKARHDNNILCEQRQSLYLESEREFSSFLEPLQPHFMQSNKSYLNL